MLVTTETIAGRTIAPGELMTAQAVCASNVVRDLREIVTNTFGGRMRRYEELAERALGFAREDLAAKAMAAGYDGVVGLRIGHPHIVDGAVAVVIYGTAFRYT